MKRTHVIAEAGVNHNGSLQLARALVEYAHQAGADAVKFQKRSPQLSVPRERWNVMRESCTVEPGMLVTELEHRERMELDEDAWSTLEAVSAKVGIELSASAWDVPSLEWLERRGVPWLKIPSARLTDDRLLSASAATGIPLIVSTGMATWDDVEHALEVIGDARSRTTLLHCVSDYPAEDDALNLRCIQRMAEYGCAAVGYSGHERGVVTTVAAVLLGATVVERHLTKDRTMRGSDHAASLEPRGFELMVRAIRVAEGVSCDAASVPYVAAGIVASMTGRGSDVWQRDVATVSAALGDGEKRISAREAAQLERLRGRS